MLPKLFRNISPKSNLLTMLTVGVFGTSKKENEFRVPIHPKHIPHIPRRIRKNLF
ncbi:unnamed protein product [marine sediment metagenome]|uniref:Uncharacterized protein n=1 Tax=marine sediment metagenome TaxID=412755 RepID=X0SI98_9ZZZZ